MHTFCFSDWIILRVALFLQVQDLWIGGFIAYIEICERVGVKLTIVWLNCFFFFQKKNQTYCLLSNKTLFLLSDEKNRNRDDKLSPQQHRGSHAPEVPAADVALRERSCDPPEPRRTARASPISPECEVFEWKRKRKRKKRKTVLWVLPSVIVKMRKFYGLLVVLWSVAAGASSGETAALKITGRCNAPPCSCDQQNRLTCDCKNLPVSAEVLNNPPLSLMINPFDPFQSICQRRGEEEAVNSRGRDKSRRPDRARFDSRGDYLQPEDEWNTVAELNIECFKENESG